MNNNNMFNMFHVKKNTQTTMLLNTKLNIFLKFTKKNTPNTFQSTDIKNVLNTLLKKDK